MTTVSTSRLGDFARCCFLRNAFFAARLVRFVFPFRVDFDALRALFRAVKVVLRSFARLFAFARFFRLAMISSPPLCTGQCIDRRQLDQMMAFRRYG